MKKIIFFALLVLISTVFVGCGKTEVKNIASPAPLTLPENSVSISDDFKKAPERKATGSCFNSADSTCTEYFGSFWTESMIRMSCDGDSRTYSAEACPNNMAGGCEINAGQEAEAITWLYFSDVITADSLKISKTACETSGVGQWFNGR